VGEPYDTLRAGIGMTINFSGHSLVGDATLF